jgi:hypothetical protein
MLLYYFYLGVVKNTYVTNVINNFSFSTTSYFTTVPIILYRTNYIWQEGLLIDFLQKMTYDLWARKFLIYSSYLFNERVLYDLIVRFFLDFIIWPFHYISWFEIGNIMWILVLFICGLGGLLNIFLLLYIWWI